MCEHNRLEPYFVKSTTTAAVAGVLAATTATADNFHFQNAG